MGLQLYIFYLSVLFLLCWEFILSSLLDLALTHFFTPPPYLHINNHVPPPPPICDWRRRLHSWPFRLPNWVKASASTNTVKNASTSSAIFKTKHRWHPQRQGKGRRRDNDRRGQEEAGCIASDRRPSPARLAVPMETTACEDIGNGDNDKDKDEDEDGGRKEDEVATKTTTR